MPKSIVIGSGIAGIAAAIRLKAKGHEVDVYETNAYPGGKLSEFTQQGFRFDAGPSLFTMPSYVDELFALCNENAGEHFNYDRLSVVCHYFYNDGASFKADSDIDQLAVTLENTMGEERGTVSKYFKKSALIYRITTPVFLENSLHKISTYFNRKGLYGILNLWRLNLFTTMHDSNKQHFRNPKTQQFFDRFATYNGSNPYKAPATLNVIPHLEFGIGAYFPKKGMFSITSSLVELAERHGVKFHYNSRVERIVTEKGKVKGVLVNNDTVTADNVICNADVTPVYRHLLPQLKMPLKVKKAEPSSSALIFYWGIKQQFKDLELHNIFFSDNYKAEFDTIFTKQTIGDDITVYVNISSKYKMDDAPEGCENWFVMVNAPANTGQDWDVLITKTRQHIITKLSRLLKVDIAALIVSESILDPRSIEQRTSSNKGALYGNSSNKRMSAFLRHANFKSSVKGLYFCGGSVHPGGGIPLSLLSAKITAGLIP
ncbi:MAG: 1-hydroxycarotenoid 3,4-desaturase CrtD [Bacteroidota bacterium]